MLHVISLKLIECTGVYWYVVFKTTSTENQVICSLWNKISEYFGRILQIPRW